MVITLESYNGENIAIQLPDTITAKIAECEPVVKGQTAASSYKPAVLENGVRIMVPPFIDIDDEIVIKSETLEYFERAK